MPTTAFNYDNAAFGWLGQHADHPVTSQGGRTIRGANSELRFKATGTEVTVRIAITATGTNYLQANVDGGGFANLTMPGAADTWSDVTVFTALSDAEHTVIIRHATGTQTNVAYQRTSVISVTGAAPAIAAYDNITNIYDAGLMSFGRYASLEGGARHNGTGGYLYPENVLIPYLDSLVRFYSDAAAISIWALKNSPKLALMQDGVQVGTVSPGSGNAYDLFTAATGLSGAHEYEIVNIKTPTTTEAQITQIVLGGGSLQAHSYTRAQAIVGLGDSKVAGNGGASGGDSTKAFIYKLARLKGYEPWNAGISGSRVMSHTNTANGGDRQWTNAARTDFPLGLEPAYVIIQYGHNDAANAVNQTDFEAAYLQMIRGLALACPTAKILCTSIFNTTAFSTTIRDNYNTNISNAVTSLGDADVTYVDTDGWIDATNDTTDGTHPDPDGYDLIVTQLAALVVDYAASGGGGGSLINGGLIA